MDITSMVSPAAGVGLAHCARPAENLVSMEAERGTEARGMGLGDRDILMGRAAPPTPPVNALNVRTAVFTCQVIASDYSIKIHCGMNPWPTPVKFNALFKILTKTRIKRPGAK